MRLGAYLPTFGPLSLSPGIVPLARIVEDAGVDSIWVADHLCIPKTYASRYPYSPDGGFPFPPDAPWFDSLTALAAIAAATERVTLGTGILVITQRNVLEVAKVTSSIDQISHGRLRLGLGAGWLKEEISALGYRPETRGRRLNEAIEVLRDCWSGRTRGYSGREVSVGSDLFFQPTPYAGDPPVLIGGFSEAAHRRAARLGDGWLPDWPIDMLDFAVLEQARDQVDAFLCEEGRDRHAFLKVFIVESPPERADELPDIAKRIHELGFDELVIEPPFDDLGRAVATIEAVRGAIDAVAA
jgi:probable F420-dependent oxidoreductase